MNAAAVIVYVLWMSLAVVASACLLERALASVRLPVRWIWLGAVWASVSLPAAALVRASVGSTAGPAEAPLTKAELMIGRAGEPNSPGMVESGSAALERFFGWWSQPGEMVVASADVLRAPTVSLSTLVAWWLMTCVAAALVLGLSLLRLRRHASKWPQATLLGHSVKISPDTGPATVGILAPRIVLPKWALSLSEADLVLILRHESEHVRGRDTLMLSAGLVAVVACPWNPLIWWQMRRLKAAVEMDCDHRVLRGGVPAARYGGLLLALGTRGSYRSLAVPTIAGSRTLLERRLKLMTRLQNRKSVPLAAAMSLPALLLLLVACESDPPVATDSRVARDGARSATTVRSDAISGDVITIRVDRDGSVEVNGSPQPLDRITEAAVVLSREGVIASIEAHRNVPYKVVAEVQEELRRANVLRVVFTTVAAEGAPRSYATLLDEGLPVVLPDTSGLLVVPRIGRNILEIEVLPTGMLDLRRGESPTIDRIAMERIESVVREGLARYPNLIVLVRTRPDADYRYMYEVLAALQRANATRFSLQLAD